MGIILRELFHENFNHWINPDGMQVIYVFGVQLEEIRDYDHNIILRCGICGWVFLRLSRSVLETDRYGSRYGNDAAAPLWPVSLIRDRLLEVLRREHYWHREPNHTVETVRRSMEYFSSVPPQRMPDAEFFSRLRYPDVHEEILPRTKKKVRVLVLEKRSGDDD